MAEDKITIGVDAGHGFVSEIHVAGVKLDERGLPVRITLIAGHHRRAVERFFAGGLDAIARRMRDQAVAAAARDYFEHGMYPEKPMSAFSDKEAYLPLDLWDSTPDP